MKKKTQQVWQRDTLSPSYFLDALGTEPARDYVEYRLQYRGHAELRGDLERFGTRGGDFSPEAQARIAASLRGRLALDDGYWTGPSARTVLTRSPTF